MSEYTPISSAIRAFLLIMKLTFQGLDSHIGMKVCRFVKGDEQLDA